MKKPNSYPNLEATLGLSEPLASTENGSFLNEEQKANIETKLTAAAKDVQTANEAKTTAEAALATEKETAKTALDAATATGTAATTQLRAAATLAGVEDLPEAATAEEINTALTAQIEVLNTKPGAVHTAGASNGEVPAGTFAIDKNNSIYSQIN